MHGETARLVLKEIFKDRGILSYQVVAALTSGPQLPRDFEDRSFRYLKGLAKEVDEGAIRSFLTSNRSQIEIESIYGELKDVIVIKDDELRAILESTDRGWTGFYHAFPDSKGIVYLSAPGFSANGNQCVVELGQQQGSLWGHGVAYLYRRTEAGWSKGGEIRTWVS